MNDRLFQIILSSSQSIPEFSGHTSLSNKHGVSELWGLSTRPEKVFVHRQSQKYVYLSELLIENT